GDGAGMPNNPRADLDELELQAGKRPGRHGLWQTDMSEKDGEVVVSDRFEPVYARAGPLSLMLHLVDATRREQRRGSS
ncbi:hypothetical protein, partial [Tropicimonas sp. IMCC6043]|uniref:hypothetical protein n=1 Tax=Tropicimonas sp. IMCC6043 TaxID=2510645 RepID=UPI001A92CC74